MKKSAKPSAHLKKKEKLEQGFLKTEEELPGFEPHELRKGKEKKSARKTKPKETKTVAKELPFETVHETIKTTCLIAIIAWFVLIIILSIVTSSNPFNTLIGLSPVLLTIIITYILVDKYNMESGLLLIFPFIFTGILFMLGIANLLNGIDYVSLSSINIIFGLLFEIIVVTHYSILKKHRK